MLPERIPYSFQFLSNKFQECNNKKKEAAYNIQGVFYCIPFIICKWMLGVTFQNLFFLGFVSFHYSDNWLVVLHFEISSQCIRI